MAKFLLSVCWSVCLINANKTFEPFCRTFLHMVDRSPGKCSLGFSCLQSVMGNEVLSNGSAHLGSPSDRQTQHFIDSPEKQNLSHKGVCLNNLLCILTSFLVLHFFTCFSDYLKLVDTQTLVKILRGYPILKLFSFLEWLPCHLSAEGYGFHQKSVSVLGNFSG